MIRGFTLLELLIAVLIIGILAAIALPQYQKAVLKSRYSALMPIAKSIANGNEVYYMEHGTYASSPASLDVAGKDEKYPDGTELDMSTGDYSFVIAGRDNNFPLNYIVYQKHSGKFAGNIHCEADENNTLAQEICQSLGGHYINGSQTDGFLTYVLSGTVGEKDKFPTSMAKLKAQICGTQFDDDHCIVDETKQTVTTTECGDSISYNANGVQTTGAGCVNITYNAEGTQIGQATTTCNTTLATYADGKCAPKKYSDTNPYETIYNADGSLAVAKYCHRYSQATGWCSFASVRNYNADQTASVKSRDCLTQSLDLDTLTCPGSYSSATDASLDAKGRTMDNFKCKVSSINVSGECQEYTEMQTTTYGDTDNDWTGTTCTEITGTSCTGKWLTAAKRISTGNSWRQIYCSDWRINAAGECPSGWKANDNGGPNQICTNGIDWETATCF